MLTVYRVKVHFSSGSQGDCVLTEKDIIKCRVVKTGNTYLTLCPYSEGHPMDDKHSYIKVPTSECYSSLEDAQAAADGKANELIARLVNAVNKFKKPADVIDRLDAKTIWDSQD